MICRTSDAAPVNAQLVLLFPPPYALRNGEIVSFARQTRLNETLTSVAPEERDAHEIRAHFRLTAAQAVMLESGLRTQPPAGR